MLSCRGILAIGHQRETAVVAAEADSRQSLVLDSGAQAQRAEVPQVHAALGERVMELHHQRLVFGTNGPDRDRSSIFQYSSPKQYCAG